MSSTAWAEKYAFDSDRWDIQANESEVVDYLGQRALRIKGGTALIKDLELADGLLEFDIAVSEERGFSGGVFRVQDRRNLEHFYIRPHQSGNPDANQYQPIFNGVTAWQLYHGEGFGVPVEYKFDTWMHIKIAFSGSRAEIYIDSDKPQLLVGKLKRARMPGSIGLNSSNFSATHFANVEVSPLPEGYSFAELPEGKTEQPKEVVTSWQISDPIDYESLVGVKRLDQQQKSGRSWTPLDADPGGITNLGRVQGIKDGKDTAFARLVICSEKEQIKGLSFGYSDAIAVYVNDTLLYRGDNGYESRDYRYLGTIGLFDKVYLPLKPGENEIWFAIKERFGGWGILAQFDDLDGIQLR